MPRYILTIDESCFGTPEQVSALTSRLSGQPTNDTLGDHPDRPLRQLLEFPEESVTLAGETRHPNWERWAPCPECGHTSFTVMEIKQSIYRATDGDIEWSNHGDSWGPILCVRCRGCDAELEHLPYDHLRR